MVLNDTSKEDEEDPLKKLISGRNSHTNTYSFNTNVTYECLPNTKFSHDYNQKNVQATCQEGNKWKVPDFWGYCAACTFRKPLTFWDNSKYKIL
jgi:hypothetical protein